MGCSVFYLATLSKIYVKCVSFPQQYHKVIIIIYYYFRLVLLKEKLKFSKVL